MARAERRCSGISRDVVLKLRALTRPALATRQLIATPRHLDREGFQLF